MELVMAPWKPGFRLSTLTRITCSALLALLVGAHAVTHALADDKARWAATWAASPQAILIAEAGLEPGVPTSLADQTVRQTLHMSVGGRAVRIVVSNAYGKAPLIIGEARVARTDAGPAIVQGSDRPLTFGGETRVVIPPGAPAISDPVELDVPALSDLSVSVYVPEATPIDTFHWSGQQTGYLAKGNVTPATSIAPDATFTPRLFVSAVLSTGGGPRRVVAAFGDSITDGSSASLDLNQRWPDRLAERLAPHRIGAINSGISGNQLLKDGMGANAVARFERDVLSQPGVESVIVLIGINDIGGLESTTVPTAGELIAGYRQLIAQAHSRGVRILGATITPFEGALEGFVEGYYTPEKEQVRTLVNAWIRTSGEFDAVVDFDLALRDPEHPTRIDGAFDSGDKLHPNDAGYRAMADSIDLSSLLRRRQREE
jgi:lysophospholipase L1-like esterase